MNNSGWKTWRLLSFSRRPKTPPGCGAWARSLTSPLPAARNWRTGRWSAGPTAALVYSEGPWLNYILTYQLMSFGGNRARGSVNQTYIEPEISYALASALKLLQSVGLLHLYLECVKHYWSLRWRSRESEIGAERTGGGEQPRSTPLRAAFSSCDDGDFARFARGPKALVILAQPRIDRMALRNTIQSALRSRALPNGIVGCPRRSAFSLIAAVAA